MTVFLETERLIFKKTEQSDFDNMFTLRTDPEVMKYSANGKLQTKEEVQRVLNEILSYQEKHGHSMCSVFEKKSDTFIGQAGLFHIGFYDGQPEIELGYRLHKKFWGKGYGTEIVTALIKWGFDHLSVTKLVAFVDPDNIASHRVLQKCGMINMGIVDYYYGKLVRYEIYKDDAIELVPYHAEWAAIAALEIKKLYELLPENHVLDIQHVGSTAIPGIHAKPIIDIQIAVDSLSIKQTAINVLKNLGYEYWAENPDPERMFFVKGMPPFGEKRTHHVHIVEPACRHWQGKIKFRDYLLSHPDAAKEYENLKIELANQHTYDREKYTETKTQFINNILKKANAVSTVDKESPFVIFLTGASGAGKTTLINYFKNESCDQSIICLHFDNIGVPGVDEMVRVYGSPSEWQKAMTYHWVQNILKNYQDKKIVILEGQVNLDFITAAFTGFDIQQYKIILVHCNNATRHQRLHQDRNQPELINDEMDKWAEFLKKQAIDKNVTILDTSLMNKSDMVNVFKEYITNSYLSFDTIAEIPTRRTARAIIINKDNQVLLLKIKGKPLLSKKCQDKQFFWVTVGGECENNETSENALKRELMEEVGISKPNKIEPIAFGEHVLPWKGLPTKFVEQFYIVYIDDINLSNRNLTHEETIVINEYRWWSLSDLLTTKEVIFPACLPELVSDYTHHPNDWMMREISLD